MAYLAACGESRASLQRGCRQTTRRGVLQLSGIHRDGQQAAAQIIVALINGIETKRNENGATSINVAYVAAMWRNRRIWLHSSDSIKQRHQRGISA